MAATVSTKVLEYSPMGVSFSLGFTINSMAEESRLLQSWIDEMTLYCRERTAFSKLSDASASASG